MQKPNFSGRWKFNQEKSTLQIPPPLETIIRIHHRDPLFSLMRIHVFPENTDTFSIELPTDGREITIQYESYNLRAHAYWEEENLVFDSVLTKGNITGRNIVKYKLADSGETLTAEECFRGSEINYDNIWVLDKISS